MVRIGSGASAAGLAVDEDGAPPSRGQHLRPADVARPWPADPHGGSPSPEPVGEPADRPEAGGMRLRALRHGGFAALFSSPDRLCRFWFQDLRRLALFLSLMRESQWLRGDEPGRFRLVVLAGQAQMSVARASQVLAACASTGDFRRRWDDRDARHLVFDPPPAARAALEQLVAECCKATAAFLGRPDPWPQLGPVGARRVQKAFVEHGLACLRDGNLGDRGFGSLTFVLSVVDLALHSPLVTADFVRREAARLRVTTVTLRNVLSRAERGGWVQRSGRMLSMPPEARERVWRALHAAMAHGAAILNEADAALACQRLAECTLETQPTHA